MISLKRQLGFIVSFPIGFFEPKGGGQEYTITGQNNLNIATYLSGQSAPTDQDITITLSGNFYATTTSTYGVDLGDLSSYQQVDIELESGSVIGGDGGNGGNSSNGTGGQGGTGLNINSNNSSANVSFTNNGTIRGGGGGGGGGVRASATDYNLSGGKTPTCINAGSLFYGGGGGGGGGRTHLNNSSGGSATTSTAACSSATNGGGGGAGTTSAAGGGGAAGTGRRHPSQGGGCTTCSPINGGAGGSGGNWGSAGSAGTSGAGGAAGNSVINRDHCAWTNNGTMTGPQGT